MDRKSDIPTSEGGNLIAKTIETIEVEIVVGVPMADPDQLLAVARILSPEGTEPRTAPMWIATGNNKIFGKFPTLRAKFAQLVDEAVRTVMEAEGVISEEECDGYLASPLSPSKGNA